MLKRVLESLDGLEDHIKALYVERNGKFFLNAEDEPETAALRRAKDREAEAARQLREQLAAKEAELAEAKEAANNKPNNKKVDDLEASWKNKLAETEKKLTDQLKKKDEYISSSLKEAAATELASVFIVPSVGKKLIAERLSVEFGEDGPKLRVMDAAGSPSAMSLEDLKKEILDNKEYAPILVGTKASGGGANGAGAGNGGAGGKTFKEMTSSERAALYKSDPQRFQREYEASKGK